MGVLKQKTINNINERTADFMTKREILILMIANIMTSEKLGFTPQFIELEKQENEKLSMKKLYRRYRVMCKLFYQAYPELA